LSESCVERVGNRVAYIEVLNACTYDGNEGGTGNEEYGVAFV